MRAVANTLKCAGQNPDIDMDDLVSVGMAGMLRTLDLPAGKIPLDKRIARQVRTLMLRYINTTEGNQKEVRAALNGATRLEFPDVSLPNLNLEGSGGTRAEVGDRFRVNRISEFQRGNSQKRPGRRYIPEGALWILGNSPSIDGIFCPNGRAIQSRVVGGCIRSTTAERWRAGETDPTSVLRLLDGERLTVKQPTERGKGRSGKRGRSGKILPLRPWSEDERAALYAHSEGSYWKAKQTKLARQPRKKHALKRNNSSRGVPTVYIRVNGSQRVTN